MKEAVAGELAAAYHSTLVDQVRASNFRHDKGRLTLHLAREFGFCYGVDRAVDYAYQAVARFPGRNVFLTGEIIHNPHVNDRLRDNGIRFLSDESERDRQPRAGRRRDPAGVRHHRAGDARLLRSRLHAGGHDVRLGAERLEERRPLRAGRVHRDHPRQGQTRGDAGHGLAGPEVSEGPVPRRARSRRSGDRLRLHPPRRRPHGVPGPLRQRRVTGVRSRRRSRSRRLRQPDDDADVGVAGDRRDVPRRDDGSLRRGGPDRAFPRLRHDLQRDAGAAGRRGGAARAANRWT